MTFNLPIALDMVRNAALILGGLTIVAYILRMRRRRFEVPFSTLWHRVLKEKENTTLWQHLRRLLSLLLQLAILALILFAVLDPNLGTADKDAKNVVVIIDASASMKTRDAGGDGERSRIAVARDEVHALLASMGGGDRAMIMRMDGQTTPLSRFEDDVPMLHKIVDEVRASDTPADLGRALSAAADALRERDNPLIVIIGDGAYPDKDRDRVVWSPMPQDSDEGLSAIDLTGIDTRFIGVGTSGENVGIVAFNVRRYLKNKMSYEVFIEVQNFGDAPAMRKLFLYNGDLPIDVRSLELAPGERLRQIYPGLSGGTGSRLRAVLRQVSASDDSEAGPEPGGGDGAAAASRAPDNDIFPLDDEAFALMPTRSRQKVLLVTEDNLYLEGAMLVYENIQVDKLTGPEYEKAIAGGTLPSYDAVVFDDFTPEALPPPSTNLVYFNPEGEHSPVRIRGSVDRPRISDVNENHPVMRWIVASDVNFDKTSVFAPNREAGELTLASYVRDPMIVAKRDKGRKIVAFGFSLAGTDLTLRVAFPLLLVNTLDWFAGDDADLITTYTTGQRFRVPMDGTFSISEVDVRTPKGKETKAPLVDGRATFYGSNIGIHKLTAKQDGQIVAQIELAANLSSPSESNVRPAAELYLGEQALLAPAPFEVSRKQSLWTYLVLLVILLLSIEWITYNRRVTV